MKLLDPKDYDARYFEGKHQDYSHSAGYTSYRDESYFTNPSNSVVFGGLCSTLNTILKNQLQGKKLLVIGCAYGFEVNGFRNLGTDAYGVDVSNYAISQANSNIAPYLEVADIRTKIYSYDNNEWDYIFSRWFLECMSDNDLYDLIPQLNRVCKNTQIHVINPFMRTDYYIAKSIHN